MINVEHIKKELLYRYLNKKVFEDEELEIERHLASCDECCEMARKGFQFFNYFNRWNAREHGKVAWKLEINEALEAVASENPGYRERIATWMRCFSGQVELAFGFILDRTGETTGFLWKELRDLFRQDIPLPLIKAEVPFAIRGKRTSQKIMTLSVSSENLEGKFILNSYEQELVVKFDKITEIPPLVMIIEKENMKIHLAEPRVVRKQYVACFSDLSPGSFYVIVEPLETRDN